MASNLTLDPAGDAAMIALEVLAPVRMRRKWETHPDKPRAVRQGFRVIEATIMGRLGADSVAHRGMRRAIAGSTPRRGWVDPHDAAWRRRAARSAWPATCRLQSWHDFLSERVDFLNQISIMRTALGR